MNAVTLQSPDAPKSNFRSITTACVSSQTKRQLPPLNEGPAPILQWVPIHLLVVDDSYQRALGSLASRHIVSIAANFDWSKFAPVIVAPIPGGMYAIIDGQHRTTAAFLRDMKEVPCQIVQADRAKQAAAFAAINAKITKLYQSGIFYAELQAGDAFAHRVASVAERAGVKIPRSKMSKKDMPPNGIAAIGSLKAIISTYGDELSITALQCVIESGDGNPGMLKAVLIRSLAEVLAQRPLWREAGERLLRAFDEIDFQEQINLAEQDARSGISTVVSALVRRLGCWLDDRQLIAA